METIPKKEKPCSEGKVDFDELNKSIAQKNRIIKTGAIVFKKEAHPDNHKNNEPCE